MTSTTGLHADAGEGDIHIGYQWSYADATARAAASGFVAGDEGKFARQLDDDSIWILSDYAGPTWVQVGGGGGGIARSGSTTDEHLAVWNGSDADSLKDGGAVPTPGGGGWPFGAITAPPLVSALTWVNQGSATAVDNTDRLTLYDTGSDNDSNTLRTLVEAATAPYTFTCLVSPTLPLKTYPGFGLCFRESVSGLMHVVRLYMDSANYVSGFKMDSLKYNSASSFNGSYSPPGQIQFPYGPVWIQIEDDNSNRIIKYSLDGFDFITFHTITRLDFLTSGANQVGVWVQPCSIKTTINVESWLKA